MSKLDVVKMVGLAVLIGAAAPVSAAGSDRADALFERVDTDGNKEVTVEELRARAAARFSEADADGDGFVTPQEMLGARVSGKASRMIERFDTDGNGQLSAAELEAANSDRAGRRINRMIQRADSNDDGKLSLAEMNAARDPAKVISRLDTDGNGSLSQEEFAKARQGRKDRSGQ